MNAMPTQRPFFANFLAAFRAHSAIQQQSQAQSPKPSPSPHSSSSASTSSATANNLPSSHPRAINKPPLTSGATTTALSALHSPRTASTSPLSRSPGQTTPSSTAGYIPRQSARRRGSDSSSEGFRDVLGQDKWYIGGRTAAGEEKFFKLGVVRRERSVDRLSLDRLSL